jgi:hypothetical protein
MNQLEQRIAVANALIADYESYRKELIVYHLRPEAEIVAKAIELSYSVIADAEAYGKQFEAALHEVHAMLKLQLDQMKLAREAIDPTILEFIRALRSSNSHRLDLEEAIEGYLRKQRSLIQSTGAYNQGYANNFNEHCIYWLDPFEPALEGLLEGIESYNDLTGPHFVNRDALALADSLKAQPALQVKFEVPFKADLNPELKQALFKQLDGQIASIRTAMEAIARKVNALEFDGFNKKAGELSKIQDIIDNKITAYEAGQKHAIETRGRMSSLKALSFKKSCHEIINDNKGYFNKHADVLPVLANFILAVASAVCAFIPVIVNKARTNSFSFFNTATFKTLAKVEKDINKAIGPSLL